MRVYSGVNNTIRKAKKWLKAAGINFQFHDLRKDGLDTALLQKWVAQVGWEVLLNKRGTTWRQIPAERKDSLDEASATALLLEYPTMIKRPVLESDQLSQVEVGFSEPRYREIFG